MALYLILKYYSWKTADNHTLNHLHLGFIKTKDINIIRLTSDSNYLNFMTSTDIFLPDCSRKPDLIKAAKLQMQGLEHFKSSVGLLNPDNNISET